MYATSPSQSHDGISDDLDTPDVGPRNAKHRGHLLPAEAGVVHEDEDREDVEDRPP